MSTLKHIRIALALILVIAGALVLMPGSRARAEEGLPVSGEGIVPIEVAGNPSCDDLGYGYGFKIEEDYNRTFNLTSSNGVLTGGAPEDEINSITVSSQDNVYFDWSSTLFMDAVIVKGGNAANAYVYIPEDNADTGLASPANASGDPAAISHIEFCYDYELTATKTANAQFKRTYTWELVKSVDPSSHSGFAGDTFSSDYDVDLDQTVTDSDFAVAGTITVNNPTPFAVSFEVSDSVGGTPATPICDTYSLAPGGTANCTYSASLSAKTDGTNTATITSLTTGIGGATATAGYTFGAPTSTEGYEKVNVTDSVQGDLGSASGDKTFEYKDGFECPIDASMYVDGVYSYEAPNTATIDETGQSDSEKVTVVCYAPVVTKDAEATYDETHTWKVEKSVDPEWQFGYPGDVLGWTWKVTVSEDFKESNFAVTGTIYVENPSPDDDMTVDVADVLDDETGATVDCGGGSTSLTVAAGKTGSCTYSAEPANRKAAKNTATATLNDIDFSGSADLTWDKTVIGGTATVTDDEIGLNESLTAGKGPWEFTGSDSQICSANAADYVTAGKYRGTVKNEAVLTDSEENEYKDDANTEWECRAGFVDLLKTTDGLVNATKEWQFALYLGPDGFGSTPIGTGSTLGDADGLLLFGSPALRPDETYTMCELGVAAGWTSEWTLNDTPVTPYNPNENDATPSDVGNRCFDFAVTVGNTAHFVVDNTFPGGDPRTPGYWKNWNTCTGGGQAANAERNGGYAEGFWLLDDVLKMPGISWDDILSDSFGPVVIDSCEMAVEILDQRVVTENGTVGDGKKIANDAARTLAMHLLAAQLNFGAGACTTQEVRDAALAAEKLLDKLDFDGTSTKAYLTSKSKDYAYALSLAKYLDEYNNGMYCGSLEP